MRSAVQCGVAEIHGRRFDRAEFHEIGKAEGEPMRPMGLMRGIGPITPLSSIEGKGNHKIPTQLHRQFGKTTSRIFNIFLIDIFL
jgi:hypothetical protein